MYRWIKLDHFEVPPSQRTLWLMCSKHFVFTYIYIKLNETQETENPSPFLSSPCWTEAWRPSVGRITTTREREKECVILNVVKLCSTLNIQERKSLEVSGWEPKEAARTATNRAINRKQQKQQGGGNETLAVKWDDGGRDGDGHGVQEEDGTANKREEKQPLLAEVRRGNLWSSPQKIQLKREWLYLNPDFWSLLICPATASYWTQRYTQVICQQQFN